MKRRLRSEMTGEGSRLTTVISGHETCGLIHDVAEELRSRGHQVTTIALPDPFFPYQYDFDQYDLPMSYAIARIPLAGMWRKVFGLIWRLNPRWYQSLEKKLRASIVRGADLYIRVWGTIPFDAETLESISGSDTRVASLLLGSDVRNYGVFSRQYGIPLSKIDPGPNDPPARVKLEALRTHEKYADAVFAVPDQMGLALRPYHHLQIPLRLDQYRFNVPARDIPVVVHAPSRPGVKGTDIIEAALANLRADGVQFEFVSIRNMPHDHVLETLSNADVLVDQLIAHGPGWLSFEAMASGCAVVTRYLDDSPECFRPPVVSVDFANIEEKLRALLSDRDTRVRLANEGRRYVEQNNNVATVVDTLLRKVDEGVDSTPDYTPTYLMNGFVPTSPEEAALVDELNNVVAGEEWYPSATVAGANDR